MSPLTLNILIAVGIVLVSYAVGFLCGWKLRRPNRVGNLLLIRDPVDGETFMHLEVERSKADYIYDGNEISVDVIDLTKEPREKQSV